MQQLVSRPTDVPAYVEKIILYYTPDGMVCMRVGNVLLQGKPEEIVTLLQNRLGQHVAGILVSESHNGHSPALV